MKVQNKSLLTGYSLTLCLILAGCGGGGSTSTSSTDDDSSSNTQTPTTMEKSTYSLSGTVPGTLIEAFCKDGSYYSVNSTDDGTENHPFTLTLPSDIECKLVMTTNEKQSDVTQYIITPILLNDGETTSSYFELDDNVSLGHIALPMSGEGVQEPFTVEVSDEKLQVKSFSYDALDTDGDNVPNVYEDDDDDGVYNKYDEDDNNNENDSDGDGVENQYDSDDDNDGTKDTEESESSETEESDDENEDKEEESQEDEDEKDEDEKDDETENSNSATITLPTSYKADAGRLLGSQCAQCHGTNGVSVNKWDSIAGEDDLEDEIFEDDEPIMSAQAHGYTSEEITLIGNWLKTLSKNDD
ncbi:MAG: hypothetical protein K0U38_10150 [Epsilonproteobacteria bacterium]|nr:hypothetical protein [Campylobacterota bacterium]